jgi:hypothetical protein
LLTIVDGLDANRRHIPSHASEITVRDTVGAHNLSLVRKIVLLNKYHSTQRHPFGFEMLASPAAGSEGAKDKELLKKARRGTPFVPCCTPTHSFHSMETDLDGAWGPSGLRIVDFNSNLASQRASSHPPPVYPSNLSTSL